jgi:radical SAM protein with 4Fe4S-binding SPASM domain
MYPRLKNCVLRAGEGYFLYNYVEDEVYELDLEAMELLRRFTGKNSLEALAREFGEKEVREAVEYLLSEGCLVDERCEDAPQSFAVEGFTPSLRYLQLHITERCNLACRHCYLGEKSQVDLPKELAFKAVEEFSSFGWKLLITGGEPLLSPYFWKLASFASRQGVRVVVLTNGTLVSEATAKKLAEHVHEVQISLDGIKRGHEVLRGEGSFAKAVRGIRAASKYMRVSVATMIHRENLKEFPQLEKLVKSLGVEEWSLDVPSPKGSLLENTELLPPREEAARIYSRYGFSSGVHEGSADYACGAHLCSVNVKGEVTKCGFFERGVGNLAEISLKEGWERIVENYLPKLSELACAGCKYLSACRGGCRFRALSEGDFWGKDSFLCLLHSKMHSLQ